MSTVDLPKSAVETFIGTLTDLHSRLDPSTGGNYCAVCDVPDITLNGNVDQTLENARIAAQAGNYLDALTAAHDVVSALYDSITSAAGPAETDELVEAYFQRLFFPALLANLKKWNHTAYIAGVALLFMDERGREWIQHNSFADRLVFLLGDVLARSIGHVTRQSTNGDEPEPEFEWPILLTDSLGFGALTYHLVADEKPWFDYWFGYGFDPPDPASATAAEMLASRALSIWWEKHPEAALRPENYQLLPPPEAAPERVGVTFLPLLAEQGGPTIIPMPQAGFATKVRVGNWEFELTRAETNVAGGAVEAKFSRVGGGNLFSLGNASKQGPMHFWLQRRSSARAKRSTTSQIWRRPTRHWRSD